MIGEALSGIFKAITFYPRYWAQTQDIFLEHKVAKFKENLEKKVEAIPVDSRILPHPSILGPSIQALEYAIFEDELRDMFVNLLSISMDKYSKNKAHPSFVEIIKQISSDEAKILAYPDLHRNLQYIAVNFANVQEIFSVLAKNSNCQFLENQSVYVSN